MSSVDLLGYDDEVRPPKCSAFAYMHWRDELKKECPECGCEEIYYWLDGSPGLFCASLDCEWDWVMADGIIEEIDSVFGGKLRKAKSPSPMRKPTKAKPRSFESELDDVFDG